MAHYGKFENVKNYIAIVGNKNDQEKAGYYGEKIVLKCPELGLNTCWVAMTYGKSKAEIKRGQKGRHFVRKLSPFGFCNQSEWLNL